MLTSYENTTRFLLANPSASTNLYSATAVDLAINIARSQIAGEAECIRALGTLTLTAAQQVYPFSSINVSSVSGAAGVFNIKQITVQVGSGATYVHPRSFQWFNQYFLAQVVPETGLPSLYAQYSQGVNGSIYLNPVPDNAYVLNVDCVCYPENLADDTTPEAIPYPWTDCVPFFACYYLYTSAQRMADADRMYKQYQLYIQRARNMSNPSVLTGIYPQSQDMTLPNKLGMQPSQGGG